MHNPIRVLFLCEGNADRSQMAEGLLSHFGGNDFAVYSAGLEPRALDPLAVQAMREIKVDIIHHTSKHLNDFMDMPFDYVITLCSKVEESCLAFPRDGQTLHWQCSDPSTVQGNDEQKLAAFREVRDAIAQQIQAWIPLAKAGKH